MEWLVDGKVHNGSHFPLCTFTHNASHRSKESQEKRAARVSKIIQGKTPKNSRSRGREDSRSRGWGPHAPTDPPPVPPHGAYVAECLPEAYGGGERKWWYDEGGGRKLWESGEVRESGEVSGAR